MLLNEVIAAVFVVLGSFRTLLSFKGTLYSVCPLSAVGKILIGHVLTNLGMVEYCCYLVTVCGLLKVRGDARVKQSRPSKTYQTSLSNPVIFCIMSFLITVQSAIHHVTAAVAILSFIIIGTIIFRLRIWPRVTAKEPGGTDS